MEHRNDLYFISKELQAEPIWHPSFPKIKRKPPDVKIMQWNTQMYSLVSANLLALDGLVLGSFIFVLLYIRASRRSKFPYPPGPRGIPFFRNLFDIPSEDGHVVYAEWAKKYDTDVTYINVFGQHLIIVNTFDAAVELMIRRSAKTSDRSSSFMLNDMIDFGNWGAAFVRFGSRLKDYRRVAQATFNPNAVKKFHEIETNATRDLLKRLHHRPDSFVQDIRHMAGRIILRVSYGFEVKPEKDPYIDIAENALHGISATANPGSYLVDSIPILRYLPEWFPGAQFKRDAKKWRQSVFDMRNKPFELVKRSRVNSTGPSLEYEVSPDSVAATLLDGIAKKFQDQEYIEDVIKSALGSFYAAGADTTLATISSFILAMILYPDVQRKAQKQIDEIIGRDRLPKFEDREKLPYIDAILLETLRWHPVFPQNIPHLTSDDDVYKGYYIPKGTIVVANTWGMSHDENSFPSPFTFNPDRFLDKDGKLNPDVRDPSWLAFGFGRRICPGRFMAKDSAWMTMISILATFDITPKIGEDGEPVMPKEEFTSGLFSYPKPFVCDIRPRSEMHKALIEGTPLVH
ncbi:cytochrome P450 family protein [Abortiporus biennis]